MSALIAIQMEKYERRKSLAIYVSYVVSLISLDENIKFLFSYIYNFSLFRQANLYFLLVRAGFLHGPT